MDTGGESSPQLSSEDAEGKKVALMRAFVESQDPAAKEVDNTTLSRFLRARNLNVEKASAMLLKYLKWRPAAVPNGSISEAEIPNLLTRNIVYIQGLNKKGQPIIVSFTARHFLLKRNLDELKRYAVYVLDKACTRMPRGQEKFICILDLKGWGYSNCDIRGYIAALDIMQSYYPERLAKALLIHVPSIFMKAWKIICPFIDQNTKEKFVFVDAKDLQATLLEEIDESQLPQIYGGKLPLVAVDDSTG